MSTYLVALVAGPVRGVARRARRRRRARSPSASTAAPRSPSTWTPSGCSPRPSRASTSTTATSASGTRSASTTSCSCPEFNAGAMENAGAVTFLEDYVFRSRVTRSTYERRAETVLHEMAHMWFGDLVTMRWWDDLWLNESFATFASVLCQAAGHRVHRRRGRRSRTSRRAGRTARTSCPPPTRSPRTSRTCRPSRSTSTGSPTPRAPRCSSSSSPTSGSSRSSPGCAPTSRPTSGATPRSTTCSARWSRPRGATCRAGARSGSRPPGSTCCGPRSTLDDDGAFTRFDVVQGGARPGAGELRTHRIAVGVYDDDGSGKLVRTHRVEVDVEGERTAVPELVGVVARQAGAGQRRRPHLLRAAAGPGLARPR